MTSSFSARLPFQLNCLKVQFCLQVVVFLTILTLRCFPTKNCGFKFSLSQDPGFEMFPNSKLWFQVFSISRSRLWNVSQLTLLSNWSLLQISAGAGRAQKLWLKFLDALASLEEAFRTHSLIHGFRNQLICPFYLVWESFHLIQLHPIIDSNILWDGLG